MIIMLNIFIFTFEAVHFDREQEEMKIFLHLNIIVKRKIVEFSNILRISLNLKNEC